MTNISFPEWMSAVNEAMYGMQSRLALCGCSMAIPIVTQLHFALYGDLEPKMAAALMMRDEIMSQRARIY